MTLLMPCLDEAGTLATRVDEARSCLRGRGVAGGAATASGDLADPGILTGAAVGLQILSTASSVGMPATPTARSP